MSISEFTEKMNERGTTVYPMEKVGSEYKLPLSFVSSIDGTTVKYSVTIDAEYASAPEHMEKALDTLYEDICTNTFRGKG